MPKTKAADVEDVATIYLAQKSVTLYSTVAIRHIRSTSLSSCSILGGKVQQTVYTGLMKLPIEMELVLPNALNWKL